MNVKTEERAATFTLARGVAAQIIHLKEHQSWAPKGASTMRSIGHFTPGLTRQDSNRKQRPAYTNHLSEGVEDIHVFICPSAFDDCKGRHSRGLFDCVALTCFSDLKGKNWGFVYGRAVIIHADDTNHRCWISKADALQRFFFDQGVTVIFTRNIDFERVAYLQSTNGPYQELTTVCFRNNFEKQAYFTVGNEVAA